MSDSTPAAPCPSCGGTGEPAFPGPKAHERLPERPA